MRSLVVVEEISMVSHTNVLQSSISQLLEYNKLEVFLAVATGKSRKPVVPDAVKNK